jgi:hypothetical protein
MGEVPKAAAAMIQEEKGYYDVDSQKYERIGRRVINAILHVRFSTGR